MTGSEAVRVASLVFLESFRIAAGQPRGRVRIEATVAEAWGIVHAHGGVVMAAMLQAAEMALGRTDFRMASASAM